MRKQRMTLRLFTRARKASVPSPTGVTMLLSGRFDARMLVRAVRADAQATGTVGWARRRSDGTVEIAAFREDGLADFLKRSEGWAEDPETFTSEIENSPEAEGENSFRIRREVLLLTADEREHYRTLHIDTESRWFPALHRSGLLKGADAESVEQAQLFWKEHWGQPVDPAFHIAFESVTGGTDPRIVPQQEYRSIWRFLNPGEGLINAYSNKLLFGRWIPTRRQPVTALACIDGRFYGPDDAHIPDPDSVDSVLARLGRGVVKPTSSDNGRGVQLLEHVGHASYRVDGQDLSLRTLTRRYRGNFILQEVVRQHEVMAEPHADSLNTLRVVTMRWQGAVRHLLTFARFGSGGRINDNAGTGGQCVGVQPDGTFNTYAVDENGRITANHPSSGMEYSQLGKIPNYRKLVGFAEYLHTKIPYFDLLSWDMAVDPEGEPVVIECNFRGAVWLYQLATGRPLFGDLTQDVLAAVRQHRSA